ncbi:Protein of unknown function, partial [Cotesia congregata]
YDKLIKTSLYLINYFLKIILVSLCSSKENKRPALNLDNLDDHNSWQIIWWKRKLPDKSILYIPVGAPKGNKNATTLPFWAVGSGTTRRLNSLPLACGLCGPFSVTGSRYYSY